MLFELRQYQVKPGTREAWVRLMEEEIIPFQVSKGMVIVGSFVGEDDDDAYVWIRRFDGEAARVQQYADVYESDHWKNVITPKITELLLREKIKVTRLVPTAKSVIH